ncbi:hypothetical protein KP509_06G022000 [Ceratopteris richardii]|uniref:Uncharacterized protein n=1 Tax=Ceratopteris richardii TaxID=49495 RepID=A0A8T2ULZ7_CERRI|nr:hypothetical protein KP509_06G022000 [Ceratopteris richardii]
MPMLNNLSFVQIQSEFISTLKGSCKEDPSFSQAWKAVEQAKQNEASTSERKFKHYSLQDEYLLYKGKVCVPSIMDIRNQVLFECHDAPSAGHHGINRTYELVKRHFLWPSLHRDVQNYVSKCHKCQVNKFERLKVGGLLHPLEIPKGKWESISMDFISGLPRTQKGFDLVWVVVDRLTKLAQFIPVKTTYKTPELAKIFVNQLYRLYGLPVDIVSDRDARFTSHFWRAVFSRLETKLSLSRAEHPRTDGQSEKVNQILEDILRAYVTSKQTDWEDYLPLAEFAYNSAKNSSTEFSSFMLMYGFQLRSPYAVGLQIERVQAAQEFLQDMNFKLKLAKENLKKAQDRAKAYADPKRRDVTFQAGDQVYIRIPERSEKFKTGQCAMLSPRYCGPFPITKKVGLRAYELQLPYESWIHPVFHVSRLRKSLTDLDNLVGQQVIPPIPVNETVPHEPERTLRTRDKRKRSHLYEECLVKWKDGTEENSTWEKVSTIQRLFPALKF